MTQASRNRLKEALHSITVHGFQKKTKVWIDGMKENPIQEMVIKIKDVQQSNESNGEIGDKKDEKDKIQKYLIQFHPVYRKVSFIGSDISNTSLKLQCKFNNITRDPLKNYSVFSSWNYRLKQF